MVAQDATLLGLVSDSSIKPRAQILAFTDDHPSFGNVGAQVVGERLLLMLGVHIDAGGGVRYGKVAIVDATDLSNGQAILQRRGGGTVRSVLQRLRKCARQGHLVLLVKNLFLRLVAPM